MTDAAQSGASADAVKDEGTAAGNGVGGQRPHGG